MLARAFAPLRPVRPPLSLRFASSLPPSFKVGDEVANPANQQIVDTLRKLRQEEAVATNRDQTRLRMLSNAIGAASRFSDPIQKPQDVLKVPRLHKRGRSLIISAIVHGEAQNPSEAEEGISELLRDANDRLNILKKYQDRFSVIPGLGPDRIAALVHAGCTTLEQLRDNPQFLSILRPVARRNFQWLEHLTQPVTRAQVEAITAFLRDSMLPEWDVIPVGDYRRGAEETELPLILLLHPSLVDVPTPDIPPERLRSMGNKKRRTALSSTAWKEPHLEILMDHVIEPLRGRGLIAEDFKKEGGVWEGIVLVPQKDGDGQWLSRGARKQAIEKREGTLRRLRIMSLPNKCKGAALLYLTGDNAYVKYVKKTAQQNGMLFNEWGLWRFEPNEAAEDESDAPGHWEMLPSETEEQVLRAVGLPYVVPEKRNFRHISS